MVNKYKRYLRDNDYVLRISTPGCNLKCEYCRREDFNIEPISDEELLDIIKACAELGIERIRWTGGEPTIMPNFKEIVDQVREYGIEKQMLSTNGTLLYKMAEDLYDAGISRVNISLDTLDRNKFTKITGRDLLPQVLKSLDKSVEIFDLTKVNTVLQRETLDEVISLIEFSEKYTESPVVRFIELVKGGFDGDVKYVQDKYCPGEKVVELIKNEYGDLTKVEVEGDNPMCYYYKINANGIIFGIVPNFSTNFACAGKKCKKIRLTPTGFISNCSIYQEFGHDMRNTTYEEKLDIIEYIIKEKQERGEDTYKKLKHYQSDYQFWRFGRSSENG